MNSIFTNALPGENEDEHIYTLKELFNQNNNNENTIIVIYHTIKYIIKKYILSHFNIY